MKNASLFNLLPFKCILQILTAVFYLSVTLFLPAMVAAEASGPGWISSIGKSITPSEAVNYYQRTAPVQEFAIASSEYTQLGAEAATPEIAELARALQNNPKLMYEYVRNHVDYVPYFGSLKGATLTYLDGSGNDFDQASLLIALLRQSGYSAQYVFGTMWIPRFGTPDQRDMQHWLGVDPDDYVISQMLSNGGIPAAQSGSYWEINRVWVRVTIDGADYQVDPAFKVYEETDGIDLSSAMQYDRNTLLGAAGGTLGADSIENMDEQGLQSILGAYSKNLYDHIRSLYSNAAMEEIIGGRKIVPEYLSELPAYIPFSNYSQFYWDQIPPEYSHTIEIEHGEIHETLNIADLSGQRLSLTYQNAEVSQTAVSMAGSADSKTSIRKILPNELTPEPVNIETITNTFEVEVADRQLSGVYINTGEPVFGADSTSYGSWDFGRIYPTGYAQGSMSPTNPNSVNITLVVSLSSNPTNAFSIVSGGGSHSVGPGNSHTIGVRFNGSGQTPGSKTGQLKVAWWYGTNNFHTDYTNLTGIVANPISLGGYGMNVAAYMSQPHVGTCRIENNGSRSLTINSMSITGSGASRFRFVSGNGTGTIPAGSYRDIQVRYLANAHGTHNASIAMDLVYDGLSYGGDILSIKGSTHYQPDLGGSHGSSLGQVYLGNPKEGVCRIQNDGSLNLDISSIQLTGSHAARFELIDGTGTGILAPGQYQDITVRYRADSIGSHSATVHVEFSYDNLTSGIDLALAGETLATPVAQLWLDDTLIAEETEPASGSDLDKVFISIDHPYAANGGSFADQNVEYTVKRGSFYTIIYDFGGSRDGRLLEKRQQQMSAYRQSGFSDTSREVISETLNVMGMTWMRDTTLNENLLGEISGVLPIRHHRFGMVAQESGYYIDVKAQSGSSVSRHNNDAAEKAFFKAINHLASALEHGVLEQMQVNRPAVSTIKLLQLTNSDNDKIFNVNSGNWAGIEPQLFNYSSDDLLDFEEAVDDGATLILPANGAIALQAWNGKGYIRFKSDAGNMSCGMIIGGDYYGGYGVVQAPVSIPDVSTEVTVRDIPQATTPKVPSLDPVDMASGYFMYNNTDLVMESGVGGLSFKRTYFGGNHLNDGSLGYGWSHNCNLYAQTHSSSTMGLGSRLPTDAVPLMAASVAILDLMAGDSDIKEWMTAALIGKWGMDNLTDNAVSVHMESDVLTYIKLPDNTFAYPPGVNAQLVMDNGLYRLERRFDKTVQFNADHKVSTVTDADGNTITFNYTGGRLSTVLDNYGHSLSLEYSGERLVSVTDSAGRSVFYSYANGDLTTYTDPGSNIWEYGYDSEHRLVTLQNPENITTVTNTYDSLGRVSAQTVPRQAGTASYNLYFSGYRNVEEDSQGSQTIYFYDDKNRLVATENALGYKTVNTYDGQNHVVLSTDPRNNTTRFGFDGNNNLVSTTNALGHETINTYDSQFRLAQVTDPLGNIVQNDYDSEHHLIKTSIWPETGQPIETQTDYYANGLVQTTTDGRGIVTSFTYDAFGNPDTTQTAAEPAIDYDYDSVGRMTSLTDQAGTTTQFDYDPRSLLDTRTDGLGSQTVYTYYDDGLVHTVTDRNNDIITYTYTPTGKVDTITWPDATTTSYTYNSLDRLEIMSDPAGITSYIYDSIGRLTSTTDANGFTTAYTYDATDNITQITYPGNRDVTYTYTALNQLKTVTNWLGQTATYNYDEAGQVVSLVNFNGTIVTYTYDNANRLKSLANERVDTSVIASFIFTLDENGNRTIITEEVPYSPVPQALDISYGYNPEKNRIESVGPTVFDHDLEGQLSLKAESTFTFDYAHRLESMTGQSPSDFIYDGADRRLSATRNGVTTRYIYDASGNLLAMADDTNTILAYFIYGAGLLATIDPSDQTFCYHFDGNGNTVALTDNSQSIINQYSYTPFGMIIGEQETVPQPFKFVGQYGVMAEPDGLYYMRARYYDADTGRFISEDPIGFDGGDVNLYGYAANNPIMLIDPFGLKWEVVDTDYHAINSTWKSASLWVAELIKGGFQGGIPDLNYVSLGLSRTTTQMWVHDPESPQLDDRFPIGTTRTFDQEMRQFYTGPNELANGPTYNQWTPYHSDYADIKSATYSAPGKKH